MATQVPTDHAPAEEVRVVRTRSRAVTGARWLGFGLLGLLLIIAAFLVWLTSDPGRRFVVRQINNCEAASGLQVRVGAIEGSVFGDLRLRDLELRDERGTFFRAPIADV